VLDFGEISHIESCHLSEHRYKSASHFDAAVTVHTVDKKPGPDILKLVVLFESSVLEKRHADIQWDLSGRSRRPPLGAKMTDTLPQPDPALKPHHTQMIFKDTAD